MYMQFLIYPGDNKLVQSIQLLLLLNDLLFYCKTKICIFTFFSSLKIPLILIRMIVTTENNLARVRLLSLRENEDLLRVISVSNLASHIVWKVLIDTLGTSNPRGNI